MGGCHINNPCEKDIKSKESCPVILNNSMISNEEPKVSNEEIKIALPVSPSVKVSNKKINNINKEKKDKDNEELNNKEMLINISDNDDNIKEKNMKNEKINLSYENLQIEEIISEEKIHTKNNHEIVFRGNLLLISKKGEFEKKSIYCVMSRINLKLYENINFFLKMKKPLFIIDLKSAKNIQIITDKELGFCFSLLDKYIFNSQNQKQLFKWIVVLNYFTNKL